MSSKPNESTREGQVNQVIAAYLKSAEEGHPLDRQRQQLTALGFVW